MKVKEVKNETSPFTWKCSILYVNFFRIVVTQQHSYMQMIHKHTCTHTQQETGIMICLTPHVGVTLFYSLIANINLEALI